MTASGSAAFNPSVIAIITQAYQQLGVIAEDEVPTAAMYTTVRFVNFNGTWHQSSPEVVSY